MADEEPQSLPAVSGCSEDGPLRVITPKANAEVNGAMGADGKCEDTSGGADLQPVQGGGVEGEDEGDPESVAATHGVAPKKKKKKSKSKGQRGLGKPTGFEEYYVDVPVTPEEYNEEQDLYNKSRTFSERIEMAIQRYKAKRKFDSERKDLFDKYMAYGGIDTGPKMFSGGLDANMLAERTAAEIATMTATNFVGADKDREGGSRFVIDFDGVVKGFLSSRLPQIFDTTTEKQTKSYTSIIRNFLNYLLHHDVCPEYKDQINAARATCDLAEKELWGCRQASVWLPGDFNTACSTIFGGYYANMYIGDQDWAKDLDVYKGMSTETAKRIFKTGLAAQATDEVLSAFSAKSREKDLVVVSTTDTGLEVTDIIKADQDVLEMYAALKPSLKPLGRMKAKTWYNPTLPKEDLTEEEKVAAATAPPEIKEYELWVEDEVLEKCFVGMKFDATLRELNCGVLYFDTVIGVHCSFYTLLPNELMIGWREPGPRLPMREKNVDGRIDDTGKEEKDDLDGDGF